MRVLKHWLNNRGLSLVEVLVSAAMTAIVSLGVATMMQNSFKEQRRIVLLDTLRNQKTKFETMMRDQAIWAKTVELNANAVSAPFNTIASSTATTEILYTAPREFRLAYTDGSVAYDLLGPSDTTGPYNGFTEKGVYSPACFYADSSGNDNCPFSYRLLIAADCPSGGSCVNPQLKLVARLIFNPASTGVLRSYANFINAVGIVDISDNLPAGQQDSKYDAVVRRTSSGVNRSFRLVNRFTMGGGAGDCSVSGGAGGTCTNTASFTIGATTGIHPRVASDGFYEEYDPYNLVSGSTTLPGTLDYFQFNEQGYYGCLISAPAFATDSFTLALAMVSGATATYQSSVAENRITVGKWSQGTAVIDAKFSVNDTSSRYSIYQKCSTTTSSTWAACTLGYNSDYNQSDLISINCYKIDRSM